MWIWIFRGAAVIAGLLLAKQVVFPAQNSVGPAGEVGLGLAAGFLAKKFLS